MQFVFDFLHTYTIILIVGLSFSIIYFPTKFFHLAHAAIITLGSYLTFFFHIQLKVSLIASIFFSLITCGIFGFLIDKLIYKSLRRKNANSVSYLVASLGIYIVLENLISIIWGDGTKIFRKEKYEINFNVFNAEITLIEISTILLSIITFILVLLYLNYTFTGKKMRAVSSNSELSEIFGINFQYIVSFSFIMGSVLAAFSGVLISFKYDLKPTLGFEYLIYGVVSMIIGGLNSYRGLILGTALLVLLQKITAFYIDEIWIDSVTYFILIIFLILNPNGFKGKRIKKGGDIGMVQFCLHIMVLISLYYILATSLNLVSGVSGFISLTHAGFYGIGAYSTAILTINFNISPIYTFFFDTLLFLFYFIIYIFFNL